MLSKQKGSFLFLELDRTLIHSMTELQPAARYDFIIREKERLMLL
uniref:Uncharacterized protein n=1 Tax=Utricularia reniformis TaxID=192314 RepID=A0A1Y0B045_9LAMI|nr:hypothetical protein AEK19_MT0484 [Utricularia reniformis]ART30741.1 hypothetical protein AEK19_MT0484 [Utricularia reniformis]